ncbi:MULTISPECIES: hypothetical protein [unclassified Nitrobacter]|uniref:hypothetical protein n=1 Tax=unclassified Nitrobacter TaxID=2620411 RepID=UPI000322AB64|nr:MULTISPECIES: hypothetical protein [unclassified Nitrobacter]
MSKILLSFALLLSFGSTVAMAQVRGQPYRGPVQGQPHSGTEAEHRACARDVSRFCRAVMDQGDFTVLACLQQNRPRISKTCNQVLVSHGQ